MPPRIFSKRTAWDLGTNAFTRTQEELLRAGAPLLDLTVSNPTDCGLEADLSLLEGLKSPGALRYSPEPAGLGTAREAIARYYNQLASPVAVDAGRLVLTTSTSEAYTFCFRLLCEPGDEVLIARPGYPLFEFLAQIQDVELKRFPLFYDHGWHIDFHSLEQAITPRTRAVIVVHPNNPTGSYVSASERTRLLELCAEKRLALISDEVFFDYAFAGCPRSFADSEVALTFTLSGLSKVCGLPQMKVAWLAAAGPAPLVKQAMGRLQVISDTYLSMNAPIQHAIPAFLESRHGFQAKLRRRLMQNLRDLDEQLSRQILCRRLEVEGGWYATLHVPALRGDEELAVALMNECGVIVHPGHFFDFESEGYLVLSLMTQPERFREGAHRILEFLNKQSL